MVEKSKMLLAVIMAVCFLTAGFAHAGEINLSAAASTKDAMMEIIRGFENVQPDARVRTNFGASGALAKQMVQGAPTDIFLSANDKWVDYVVKEGKAEGKSRGVLASNRLVFVGRKGVAVTSLADLKGLQRIALGTPASVPAGQYTEQAMRTAGVYEDLHRAHKLVMAQDVRQALLYAERGEVDGAFVYQTDALLTKEAVVLFEVPDDLYDHVAYPMVMTTAGAAKAEVRAFYSYLAGPEALEILKKFGFVTEK